MLIRLWGVAFATLVALGAAVPLTAQAPAGATAKCKDNSYSTSTSHRGACKGHGGVAEWLSTAKADTKSKPPEKTAAPTEAAAAPAGAPPADATAKCKDGSYSTSSSHRGACKGHGGVSEWLAETKAETKTKTKGAPAAAAAKPAPTTAEAPAAAPAAPAAPAGKAPAPAMAKAPPSGAPADATAQCKDGSYSHAQHHRGACSKHGGVQQWLKDIPE